MNYDLPEFDHAHAKRQALPFAKSVFAGNFKHLNVADDGRCRITFDKSYFVLQGDNTEPSKSQWSTLKKKMKRHNRGVFVFKETGKAPCTPDSQEDCYYVDFGFFKYKR